MSAAIQRFLDALRAHGCEPKPSGDGHVAKCPAHEDRHASLSVGAGDDGRVLLKCHVGCAVSAIVGALGLGMAELFERREGSPSVNRATAQRSSVNRGLTLAEYSEAKRLDPALLRDLGLTDVRYLRAAAVRIPYRDAKGEERSVRFRIALTGPDRFRWKKDSKAILYGLWRLPEARRKGYVVIVEGESDAHTLWQHDEPAIGMPGASTWNEARDAAVLDGIEKIYVFVEPDRGGDAVLAWIARSKIRDRVRLVTLTGAKDPSGFYLLEPATFRERWAAALASAEPWTERAAADRASQVRAAEEKCAALAAVPRILDAFARTLAATGVVGEVRTATILFLALVSRLLKRPVSVAVKGPSSGGKSFLVERVLTFFPPSAFYTLSAMSERALAYSEEPVAHRFLVIFEAAGLQGDFASYLVRSLLSEGRVRYETVEKTSEGLQARLIEREGPTGLIVTTTAVRLHPENETRLLSLTVTDTPAQTAAVLDALAEESSPAADLAEWHALQVWIEAGERRVHIPFAKRLASLIRPVAVRLRRDFGALLTLIRANALLHRASRERDGEGRIVATLEDYEVVRGLVGDFMSEGVGATVPPNVRETVKAVRAVIESGPCEVTVNQVAASLRLDKSAASRRVSLSIERGYLRNEEDRKGRTARLVIGDPLPDDMPLLPSPEALAEDGCAVAPLQEGIEPPPDYEPQGDGPTEEEERQAIHAEDTP